MSYSLQPFFGALEQMSYPPEAVALSIAVLSHEGEGATWAQVQEHLTPLRTSFRHISTLPIRRLPSAEPRPFPDSNSLQVFRAKNFLLRRSLSLGHPQQDEYVLWLEPEAAPQIPEDLLHHLLVPRKLLVAMLCDTQCSRRGLKPLQLQSSPPAAIGVLLVHADLFRMGLSFPPEGSYESSQQANVRLLEAAAALGITAWTV